MISTAISEKYYGIKSLSINSPIRKFLQIPDLRRWKRAKNSTGFYISIRDTHSLRAKQTSLKNVRRSNKGANLLIILGIAGLIVAVIVGFLIWRAILD